MEGIPKALPALLYAHKVLSKAERIGAPIPAPVDPGGELGAVLLALVAHARAHGLDAEAALRAATDHLRASAMVAERGPV
jgi:XTP/dITP diphosphohydrolase